MGTTDLDWFLIPNLCRVEVRMKTEAPSAKSGHHRPWCPHFENREAALFVRYKQKIIIGRPTSGGTSDPEKSIVIPTEAGANATAQWRNLLFLAIAMLT